MSNKQKKFVLDSFDAEELAAAMCGLEDYEDTDDVEKALYQKFEIDLDNFTELVRFIFAGMSIGVSPLTESIFIGVSDDKKQMWLAKKEYSSEFIAHVLQWLGAQDIDEPGAGMLREITNEGEIEYEITVRKPGPKKLNYTTVADMAGKDNIGVEEFLSSIGTSMIDNGDHRLWILDGVAYKFPRTSWAGFDGKELEQTSVAEYTDKELSYARSHFIKIWGEDKDKEANPLPEGVKLTVYCEGNTADSKGFSENVTSDELGLNALIAHSWILQSDLDILVQEMRKKQQIL